MTSHSAEPVQTNPALLLLRLLQHSIHLNIMSLDYIRGVVSGKKARYVDPDHAVDLDLVYGEFGSF